MQCRRSRRHTTAWARTMHLTNNCRSLQRCPTHLEYQVCSTLSVITRVVCNNTVSATGHLDSSTALNPRWPTQLHALGFVFPKQDLGSFSHLSSRSSQSELCSCFPGIPLLATMRILLGSRAVQLVKLHVLPAPRQPSDSRLASWI